MQIATFTLYYTANIYCSESSREKNSSHSTSFKSCLIFTDPIASDPIDHCTADYVIIHNALCKTNVLESIQVENKLCL